MFLADNWNDFEVLYASNSEKLERWGEVILRRPDPQVIWPDIDVVNKDSLPRPNAIYVRSSTGGGSWSKLSSFPNSWKINYELLNKKLTFKIFPTAFKHTGLFPEQAANWEFCASKIKDARDSGRTDDRILNLFAYTGGATVATASAGANEVVHVDASKGMIAEAKENVALSGLDESYIRFIAEDCRSFVEREIRRGRKYDGIIMDPPAYGRGPSGELWKLEEALYELAQRCTLLLSDNPLFFIISSYTAGVSTQASGAILRLTVGNKFGGKVVADELCLPIKNMGIFLPCGCTARWSND